MNLKANKKISSLYILINLIWVFCFSIFGIIDAGGGGTPKLEEFLRWETLMVLGSPVAITLLFYWLFLKVNKWIIFSITPILGALMSIEVILQSIQGKPIDLSGEVIFTIFIWPVLMIPPYYLTVLADKSKKWKTVIIMFLLTFLGFQIFSLLSSNKTSTLTFIPQVSAKLADSPWPTFMGDTKHTGQSAYDTSETDGSVEWKFETGSSLSASPTLGEDGTIYVIDQDCILTAINPDGTEKWKFDAGDPITSIEWRDDFCSQSSPTVAADGTIYFGTMTGDFFAVDKEGKEKWRYPVFMFKNIWSSPAVAPDGTIYIGSEQYPPRETGKLEEKTAIIYALNPDGTEKWSHDTGSNWSSATPAIADDETFYTTAGIWNETKNSFVNALYAFNADGTVKWNFLPPNGVPEGSPSIASDGTIYISAKGNDDPRDAFFYAVDPADGTMKWKYDLAEGTSITPAIATDGTIYFGDWGGTFFALSPDGTEKWRVETPKGYEVLSSSPAIGKEGTVYFGSLANLFYALNPDGTEKWKYEFDMGGVFASPSIAKDGTVYVATMQGDVYAFGKDGQWTETASPTENTEETNSGFALLDWLASIIFGFLVIGSAVMMVKNPGKKKLFLIAGSISFAIAVGSGAYVVFYKPKPAIDTSKSPNNNFDGPIKEGYNPDDPCPHHIYGTEENGFYGAFFGDTSQQTRDLTSEDITWMQENCPDTTWPEHMRE